MSTEKVSAEAVKADATPDSEIRLKMQWRDPIATTVMAVLTVLIAFTTRGTAMVSWAGSTSPPRQCPAVQSPGSWR